MTYFLHTGTRPLSTVLKPICFFWGQSRTHCTVCLQKVHKVVPKWVFNLPKDGQSQRRSYWVHNNHRTQLERAVRGRQVPSAVHQNWCIPQAERAAAGQKNVRLIKMTDLCTWTERQTNLIEVEQHSSMRNLIMGNVLFRFGFQLEGKNFRLLVHFKAADSRF